MTATVACGDQSRWDINKYYHVGLEATLPVMIDFHNNIEKSTPATMAGVILPNTGHLKTTPSIDGVPVCFASTDTWLGLGRLIG